MKQVAPDVVTAAPSPCSFQTMQWSLGEGTLLVSLLALTTSKAALQGSSAEVHTVVAGSSLFPRLQPSLPSVSAVILCVLCFSLGKPFSVARGHLKRATVLMAWVESPGALRLESVRSSLATPYPLRVAEHALRI